VSATYWAVKLGEDRWYDFTYDYFRGAGQRGPDSRTGDADKAAMVAETFAAKLVKVTRFDKTESRQRAEARGEVRALEVVKAQAEAMCTGNCMLFVDVESLLADAKKRARLGGGV
jgi:hypothetical protein